MDPKLPGGKGRDAIDEMFSIAHDVEALERDHRIQSARAPDAGFAWATFRWASGHQLEAVLDEADLAAGDFVRWCKQLVDLLGQVAQASADTPDLQKAARDAIAAVRRGVVASDIL